MEMMEKCPLCSAETETLARLRTHLIERHGIDPLKTVQRPADMPEYGDAYEWGKPFSEKSRTRIPEGDETAEPHLGEVRQTAIDEHGNAVNISPQSAVAEEIRRDLRGHGVNTQYIWIRGPGMKTQYTASPLPILYVVLIIAIAIITVMGVTLFVARELYQLFISPLPDWLEPFVAVALIGGTGYIAYKIVSR